MLRAFFSFFFLPCNGFTLKMIPVLTVLLCITQTFALYPSNGDVVELTPSNFDRLVVQSDEVWVVEVSETFFQFPMFDSQFHLNRFDSTNSSTLHGVVIVNH